jgi:hypothetical protein
MPFGESQNCATCHTNLTDYFTKIRELTTECKELRRIAFILLDFHLDNTDDPTLDSMFDMIKISNVNKYSNFLDVKDFLERNNGG